MNGSMKREKFFMRTGLRLPNVVVATELALVLIGWVTYALLGPALLSFIYSKGLIKRFSAAANPGMLDHYIDRADQVFLSLLSVAALLIVFQVAFLRLWQTGRGRVRTVSRTSGYRYVIFALLAVMFGCFVCLGILVASNRLFVHRLAVWKEIEKPSFQDLRLPALNERQVMNLGWAHHPDWAPLSSYIYHPMKKPSGTYRIGTFGDSFTEGEETALGHDYPSFLQEQLREAGQSKVEVINFGVRGYGMQQSFLLYEYIGRRYDLDAVIFMPFLWFYDRDNTFKLQGSVGALHARYVLAQDGLRLVTIDEQTRRQAFENYYSLLPPFKYWRFDANSANLLTTFAVSDHVPRSNPFYYEIWRGYRVELPQLYSMMFAKVAEEIGNVMLVGKDSLIESLDNSDRRITVLKSQLGGNAFLILGPKGHLSAIGNQMRAAEISEWITGRKSQLRVPTISDSDYRPTGEEESLSRISLTEILDAWIEIEGHPVAGFFVRDSGQSFWRFSEVDFGQQGIRAIIQIRAGEQPVFLPVDFPVQDGAPLELRISSSGGVTTRPIGTVDCVANSLCRARFAGVSDLAQIRMDWDERHVGFTYYDQVSIRNGYFDAMDVLVSGRPILRGQRHNRFADLARRFVLFRSLEMLINKFELKPVISNYLFFRAKAGHYVNPMSLPSHGPIKIGLRRKDGTVLRLGSFLQYAIP